MPEGLVLSVLFGVVSLAGALSVSAAIKATIDIDEHLDAPVPHRYIHGLIPDDAKFQLALPDKWNGKLVIFSRGFSGTELTPGAFKTTALEKGYAFAASDEGWNRLTIAKGSHSTSDAGEDLSRSGRPAGTLSWATFVTRCPVSIRHSIRTAVR